MASVVGLISALARVWGAMVGVVLLVAGTGAVYQQAQTVRDMGALPPPGRLVDIGGYRLHIVCTGDTGAGRATVVMDGFLGVLYWRPLAAEVQDATRVCTYDRAGEGWSDAGPAPRTSGRMVDELHRLLDGASERGPYVLVGSGLGGYNARLFASRFPAEVAGVVLVDTVTEDQPLLNATPLWLARTVEVAGALGVVRLKGGWTRHPPSPPELWPTITALRLRTASFLTTYRERIAIEDSAAQVRAAWDRFPDVPLVVITPGPPRLGPSAPPEQVREVQARWQFWSDEHERVARTSPRGRHVVAQATNAPLPITAPAAILGRTSVRMRPTIGDERHERSQSTMTGAHTAHTTDSAGSAGGTGRTKVEKTDAEWRRTLTPEQYHVLRQKGTERAFTGAYAHTKQPGTYRCAGCGQPLFHSDQKYDSGTGWPSFWAPVEGSVDTETDRVLWMTRTEVHCSACGGHLGHVFEDGPRPTGLRYCINSAALTLGTDKAQQS